MTTTKRQREDDKFYFAANTRRTPPILPQGHPQAPTSHQPGSGATEQINANTNLVVDITEKSPRSGSETITEIWAHEQNLGLEFLETLAADDPLFRHWLEETERELLEPDHSDLTFPPKVCYLCSVQTPGI